jgi:DNA-binding MarR family transcriptional regulator
MPLRSNRRSKIQLVDLEGDADRASDRSDASVEIGALGGMIGYALRRAQLAVFEDFIATLAPLNLKPAEFSVLIMLDQSPGCKHAAIAIALGIRRSNFVALIDRLERRGLTRRTASETDGRSHALYLTDVGAQLLARARTLHSEHEARQTAALGAAQRDQVLAALQRLERQIS